MAKASLAVGVDIGTSKSLLAMQGNHQGPPEEAASSDGLAIGIPSLISQESGKTGDLKGSIRVGSDAHKVSIPARIIRDVKRHLGDSHKEFNLLGQSYRPEEVAAVILRQLCFSCDRYFNRTIRDIVLSVPTRCSGASREALLAAARIAGLNPLAIINEATATALSYIETQPTKDEENLLIFDFGAGALSITVIKKRGDDLDIHSSHRNAALGGSDFDKLLQEWVQERFSTVNARVNDIEGFNDLLLKRVEEAKHDLSDRDSTEVSLSPDGENSETSIVISKGDFVTAVRPLLARMKQTLDQALEESLGLQEVDRVLMVGGMVHMPAIRDLVSGVFGQKCVVFDVFSSVAKGASISATYRLGAIKKNAPARVKSKATHGIGLKCGVKSATGQLQDWYFRLVSPDQQLPHAGEHKNFSMQEPTSGRVKIELYEGDAKDHCPLNPSFKRLLEKEIDNIPVSASGKPHPLSFEFIYKENATLDLRVIVEGTGRALSINYDPRLTNQEIQQSAARVSELWNRVRYVENESAAEDDDHPLAVGLPSDAVPDLPADPVEPATAKNGDSLNLELGILSQDIGKLKKGPKWARNPKLRDRTRRLLDRAALAQKKGSAPEKEELISEMKKIIKELDVPQSQPQ